MASETWDRHKLRADVRLALSNRLLDAVEKHKLTRGEVQFIVAQIALDAAKMTLQSEAEDDGASDGE